MMSVPQSLAMITYWCRFCD